jgi:uncharacterized protein
MRLLRPLLSILAFTLLSCLGTAQSAPAIDPAKAADIRKLLDLVGTREIMQQSFGGSLSQIKPLVTRSLPPGEYRAKLVDLFFEKFQSKIDLDNFMNLAVPVYDKYFSADEIKQMIKFYETPIGKKAIATLPKLTGELSEMGQKWGAEIGRESMNEVLAEHPDLAMALEEARKGTSAK